MGNPITLTFGLLLGFVFVGVMVFKVLPPLDQIVKRNFGTVEACLTTRFCCLVVALPFYVFTIWMTVVILASKEKGISVIEDICNNDYECSKSFALGRAHFDKDACTSPSCDDAHLYARSGSHPLSFPRLGLGKDLSPESFTVDYQCEETSSSGLCVKAVGGGDTCVCTEQVDIEGFPFCEHMEGCLNDIDDSTRTQSCTASTGNQCTEWTVDTDSAKQFTFQNCSCVASDCSTFKCDVFLMEYFYPNVFYAGAATILFIFPMMLVTYIVAKTQLRKLIKCNQIQLRVYDQGAGAQQENTAENLASGGFTTEQKEKQKYRTFSTRDLLTFIFGPAVVVFFSFLSVQVAGRIGLSFVALSASLIALFEIVQLIRTIIDLKDDVKERVSDNMGDPAKATL